MERTGLCPIDTREFPDAFLAAYLESERDVFLSGRRDRIAEQVKIDRVPIARIKRIMKRDSCDPRPEMVAADSVKLLAFATQLFIGSLTRLAWDQNGGKRAKSNTLSAEELHAAVQSSPKFDFLVDELDKVVRERLMPKPKPQPKTGAARR